MASKKATEKLTATELCEDGLESGPRQLGRRLILTFIDAEQPELKKAEFHAHSGIPKFAYIMQRDDEGFSFIWSPTTRVPQAIALLFLEYKCAALAGRETGFSFPGKRNGSLAASLGDAMGKNTGRIYDLFTEHCLNGTKQNWIEQVFTGKNLDGKADKKRRIEIKSKFLPADCVEIFWDGEQLVEGEEIWNLAELIRKTGKLEATHQPKFKFKQGEGKETKKKQPEQAPPRKESFALQDFEFKFESDRPAQKAKPANPQEKARRKPKPRAKPIPKELFAISNPNGQKWDDSDPLIDFGDDDSGEDIWRIRDACEGLLILGAPGSGKTSASGFMAAAAFLASGFGALVLTAKTDEAERWKNLCKRFGRENDCVVVTPNGPHRLNALAYEAERPRQKFALTDDLVEFTRTLIEIIGREPGREPEQFWRESVNNLLRQLFTTFLLARETLTIDRLVRFVDEAPREMVTDWQQIGYFSDILKRAEKNAKKLRKTSDLDKCLNYWTSKFQKIPEITRGGIVTAFESMASIMSAPGVRELIGTETTITPEAILSGKVVILDMAAKLGKGGEMVQAAWKYLTQRAVERRADKGLPTARAMVIWEDEGHLSFSPYDSSFQPTCRDVRAAHVVISQNLHNFYQLGHSPHAVMGVFSTMNTHIYHTNGCDDTNRFASSRIGTISKLGTSFDRQPPPKTGGSFDKFIPGTSSSKFSFHNHEELAVKPEEFRDLKRGGDGTCEAYVVWLGHKFRANGGRRYCKKVFFQDERPKQ